MDPLHAVQLVNLFPTQGEVTLRGGYSQWSTGMSGDVKSVHTYGGKSANKLFACTDAGIYDCTAGGAVGAVATSLTNGLWDAVNFNNSAGDAFIWGCNGTDKVKYYNGTAWSDLDSGTTPALTGVAATSAVAPWIFKRRIWFIEKATMNCWFLPIDSIAGAASKFPVGALFTRGGYLMAGASWTNDGGDGPDDFLLLLTSEGELAIYKGTDPTSASSFGLVGVFFVGKPLSRRAFVSYGGDVLVMTEMGTFPVSKATAGAVLRPDIAVTDRIRPTFADAARLYAANAGWQSVVFAPRNALIINIPASASTSYQYVMNTITGAWCSFTGWNALCFTVYGGALFFGIKSGILCKAWDGNIVSDNGSDITGTSQQAFNYFGAPENVKKVGLVRPQILTSGTFETRVGIAVDFNSATYTTVIPRGALVGATPWDTSPWDTSPWSAESFRVKRWIGPSADAGFAVSLFLQFLSKNATLAWSGTDVVLEPGMLI